MSAANHCPRCAAGEQPHESDVPYQHGPYAWLWSHDVSAPEHADVSEGCTFTFGCSRCDVVEVSIGENAARFYRFARRHRHGRPRILLHRWMQRSAVVERVRRDLEREMLLGP